MKPETKLKLRKWAISTLRAIVWHVDEWIYDQEVKLREEISGRDQVSGKVASISEKTDQSQDMPHRAPARPGTETFEQWELRRNVAPISKKAARRRGMPARAFDLRFSPR